MVEPLRHRQTKGAATAMFYLMPPRHISTLPKAVLGAYLSDVRFTPDERTSASASRVEAVPQHVAGRRARKDRALPDAERRGARWSYAPSRGGARGRKTKLGRRRLEPKVEAQILELKAGGDGILKIGRKLGIGTSVVQRVFKQEPLPGRAEPAVKTI